MAEDIDVRTLAPMFGVSSPVAEPDYLEYDIRGRGLLERTFFNCGVSYLVGMFGGGAYGAAASLRAEARGASFRVSLNALMNGFGKRGAVAGNALGACALMYTCWESFWESMKVDQLVPGGYSFVAPVAAGVSTGVTYKSLAGPRAVVLAGLLGGTLAALLHNSPTSLR